MRQNPFSKSFSLPVSEIMDRKPLVVYYRDPLTRVRSLFRSMKARIAYVIDPRTGKLLGRITRADLLAITSIKSSALTGSVMEDPPIILSLDNKISDALNRMLSLDEWYAPVVNEGKLVGNLGLENIIESMVKENPDYLRKHEVEEIMTREVEVARPEEFVSKIWDKMRELNYAGLPVVDDRGRLVGIVTQYDLLASGVKLAYESSSGPHRGPRVKEIMTSSVIYLYPWSSIFEAAELIVKREFGRIPIVESESSRRLIGIIDREDIVKIAFLG